MRWMTTYPTPHLHAEASDTGSAGGSSLISRDKLFGNPTRIGAKTSPDGHWLSWIAPVDGVLNLWVAPRQHPDEAQPLTHEQTRPIRSYFWSPDSRHLLYVNDQGGDENFRLFAVEATGGEPRLLTPQDDIRVMVIGISPDITDHLLIGLNDRDPRWHDVYRLYLADGRLEKVLENEGYGGFLADDDLNLRLAMRPAPDGGEEFFRVSGTHIDAEPFATVGFEDSSNTGPAGFTRDGQTLYWIDSRGRDTAALTAQNWESGEVTVIAHDARADITDVMLSPERRDVQAWSVEYLREQWYFQDDAIKDSLQWLDGELKGDIHVTSRSRDDRFWIVVNDPVTAPAHTWLFDRETQALTSLFVSRPELEGAPLNGMTPLEITSRDGLTLTAYLTLPEGASDGDGFTTPAQPLPMVLLVHGGPWARDGYGNNSYHQWLSNRGYAVLSVNFRGSTGFGKRFTSAGDGEWGTAMHNDLLDAVDWAVSEGVADKARVAIMGGSYGGYATLAGLTMTPDVFACGVDIVGPSNLETLLDSIPAYWEAGRQQMYRRMASPDTEEGQAWLRDRSPLTHAERIKRPLLIGQGANDPRVKQAESDQIVDAMHTNDIPVTYVLFPDEGHGFARPVNNIAFNAVTEAFLADVLGGRFEPIGDALDTSSITVPHGAEYAPGLAAALAT